MANIKVAVRMRPISARELNFTGSEVVVCAESNEISLTNLKISSSKAGDSRERTRRYGFDYCFDSSDPKAKNYATQAMIYETLGQSILDALFDGYNSCLVAYGQSASGKTYTMMGTKEDPGLIPRLCEGIFSKVEQESGHERIYRVTVSYLEIYNEKVRDLLKPSTSASGLRIREHPRLGPYVQGLTHHVVRTLGSLMSYVEEGTKARKTASTLQNPSSSRSHALLTVDFSQDTADAERLGSGSTSSSSRRQDITSRGGSRLHLVDLAGSESAATCGGVHRLKEGANINKSLVALGNVISALAERGSTGSGPGRRYIPYRDSSLTWLLKDALGGNATTIMLATISPASGSYNETAHTLRFAQRAQSVVNRPVVNEDPVERLIRELKAEVARLKSLLLAKDIDQQTKASCCCSKVQSSKDWATDPQYCGEPESLNTLQSDCKDKSVYLKNDKSLPIRRSNSSDSVTTYETGSSGSIRKFNSYEHLQFSGHFADNYNQAKIAELNEKEDEVVSEINEPVFVDIPTLVAVLIKPDNNLQESSTQIEEICSDEVQENSIDADFIQTSNEEFDKPEKIDDVDPGERSNSTNSCNALDDSEIGEHHQIPSECPPSSPASVESSRSRGKFSKQNSIDLPSSNLNVSKKFGSIEGISKKKESTFDLQRSHTNLEKRSALSDRGKKLNNIREIDDRKANVKSANIWKAIGNVDSKDRLQRKSSNESDKSLKDSSSGKTGSYSSIGRKPSLENLKRKTSKDSSSSSSKEEQILISNLTRDKLLHRKNSLDQEAAIATANGVRHHTTIQRVKRADIVAAVTERLYSSRKHTEETSMASSNASDTRSPPEGTDVKISNSFIARSRLQEISRKMLMKRRRINVDTQTEAASTLRFKDTACSTDEPKIVFQDAAVLTDNHMDCDVMTTSNHRLPVLRVKDMATLTDRRPQTNIFHCKDAESLVNDLEFDDYELHSPRNDSGVLSDDTQNYAESNLSSAEVSEFYPESDRRAPRTDSSTNTFLASSGKNSAVQTARSEATSQRKENPESRSCNQCCSVLHAGCNQQRASASDAEKNVISISLPDMINITIESTNGLESKIAVMDGTDAVEERVKPVFNDKECQTDQLIKKEVEGSFLNDLAIRSTAIQADGRVFRIENIFQDPRSKSCDVVSDLKKETKSVTFRNSLGTSSVIETKESSTETEWNGTHVEDIYQRKWSIPRESLTRAFIAKKRSYSLSPKRSAHKLAHHNVWKNLTLSCSEFPGLINHNRKMRTVSPCTKKDTNFTKNLLFSSMRECRECTPNNNVLEETSRESSNQNSRSSFKDSKSKSVSVNNLLDYDYNFSDDSLDYDKDDVTAKSVDVKVMDSNDRKYCESFCPPDVVAHTKNEASKSTHYVNSANVESSASIESSTNDNFDDTEIELPKRKPAEILNKSSIQDYKELILGMSSYVIDSDSEEANVKMTNHSDVKRKKVSFLNLNSPEEIADTMINHENSVKQTSEVALKPIIKKMNKRLAENSNILQPNTEAGQFSQKKTESTASNGVLLALKEDSKNSEKPSDKKMESFNKNHLEEPFYKSNGVFNNEDTRFRNVLKKNIFEEYLNEATIFMRNMNSMNEYMSVTNAQRHKKRHKKRNNRRGSNPNTNKDYIEIYGRKINLKNDIDKYLQPYEDEIIDVESYEKCLRGIERLEACIDKTNKHNQILQDRYGIGIESAGAKSSLASPSVDSRVSSINDSAIHSKDVIHKDVISDVESCDKLSLSTISLPPLSSIRTGITKQSMLSKLEKFEADTIIDKYDSDYKNNNITPENDLERGIFDQLMRAADSSKCLNLRQPGCLLKTSDFGSRSPTTYSKFWETFRQNARRILTFDEVSAVEDYLGDIRKIENSPRAFRKTKFSDLADIDSETSIDSEINFKEFYDCNELPREENDNLLKIDVTDETTIFKTKTEYPDCLIDSMRSIDAKQISYAEEIARRSTQKSRDSLRMESMNIRFSGPLNIELKYPGSPKAKFLELLRERRQIVEKSRGTNAF